MCGTCGCGSGAKATVTNLQTGATTTLAHDHEAHEHVHADGTRHSHAHGHDDGGHDHSHDHTHPHGPGETHEHVHADGTRHSHSHDNDQSHGLEHDHARSHVSAHLHAHGRAVKGSVIELETRLLAKNDTLAARNRAWLEGREILALNLVSSPGAGKTTLLERTIRDLGGEIPILVIEGDQATDADGARIRAAGAPAVQVNTGTGCHLEADMVARALVELAPAPGSLLMIENVGNLVCPALFDLGERAKVAILSVTEGDDKPLKYPHMFKAADLMLLNKTDLLPHVDFDVARCAANARAVNPKIEVLEVSARTGEGLQAWYDRLRAMRAEMKGAAFASLRGS